MIRNIRISACGGLTNSGGLGNLLYFAKKSEITSIVAPLSGTHEIVGASPFTMATSPAAGTFKVIELSPVPGKKTWDTPKEGDVDSTSWGVTIVGFHPGTNPVKGDSFTSIVGCEHVVIAIDKNG